MNERRMTAEERRKLRTKMLLAGAGGAALGGATAYAVTQAAGSSKAGKGFRRLPGKDRAEVLIPAAVALGVGAYGANYMRNRAKRKYLEKNSSFDAHQWVLDSLRL
jgi:hypothetical protein